MKPRLPCPATTRADCGLQHFSVFTWRRGAFRVSYPAIVNQWVNEIRRKIQNCQKRALWRENAHFIDADTHFDFDISRFCSLTIN
jgi:hypothetical protein